MKDVIIERDIIRNHIDTIILHLLTEQDRYGYAVCKEVLERTGGAYELKEPSLYSAFRRLERDKLIASYWGDESQGGRRKYYAITDAGKAYYAQAMAQWQRVQEIMTMILGPEGTKQG